MRYAFLAAVIVLGCCVGSAYAATPSPVPPPVVMPGLPADAKPQPVAFSRLVGSVPLGTPWVKFEFKPFTCTHLIGGDFGRSDHITWTPEDNTFPTRIYEPLISNTLKTAGFVLSNDPDNLFQKSRQAGDLQLAGNVKNVEANLCLAPHSSERPIATVMDATTGYVIFDIEWQLYSSVQDKVLLRNEIRTGIALDQHAPGNYPRLIQGAVSENVRALIASDDFRSIVLAAPGRPSLAPAAGGAPLTLTGSLVTKSVKISDAVGSVVLILSGGGHGSGFLVSSDGYVMTAEHVVGSDKYVKVHWSDGLEGVGEVVRTDKRRDVAIIKVDPRGRQPLGLHRAQPQPGDTVFAIGAPLDIKNQGTVTRGVASANRIMDGFSFIQSDVTINGGNSGGPLLNEKGEVLGICDLSFRERGDVPTGINYFVPIDGALRFLSAEPR